MFLERRYAMKKILIVILVIFLCVAAGTGIFIATFNADRYRPTVVQKVSEVLGVPVELGRLSLVWKNGVALRLENFSVYTDMDKKNKSIELPDASAVIRLMPLLHKEVQIASISLINPTVFLQRNADGIVKLEGTKISADAPDASTSPEKSSGISTSPEKSKTSLPVSVDSLVIKNGRLDFKDDLSAMPAPLSVRDLDVKVKNFSLVRPFSFDITAALFSAKQNVHLSGLLMLPQEGQKGSLEKFVFKTGLADWDLAQLSQALPSLEAVGLEGNLGGRLELQCDHMDLDAQFMKNLEASVKLQNGAVKLQSQKSPFENIQLTARFSGENLTIENFSSNFAKGLLKGSGTVQRLQTETLSDFKLGASDLAIDELMPEGKGGQAPHLGGRLSVDFEGKSRGLQWAQISETLSGQGRFSLRDGVLLNYNLLREVIEKISIIPGAENIIQQYLPDFYKAKMGEPSTLLKPMDLPFNVQNGKILFDRLLLETDLLSLEGAGEVGLNKIIQARAILRMDKGLSGILVKIVPQVQFLTNPRAEVEIPMQIQGQLPQVMVLPDREYLTQKLLVSTAQQLVTSQVRNLLEKPAEAGEAGVDLKNLFNQAIGNIG
jgi:hypothetical protein